MLPAAQRADASDVELVHGKVAAIAFTEYRTLHMGRLQLAALRDGFTIRANDPLRDIEATSVALRKPQHHHDVVALRGLPQRLGSGTVIGERVVEIARHEAF